MPRPAAAGVQMEWTSGDGCEASVAVLKGGTSGGERRMTVVTD